MDQQKAPIISSEAKLSVIECPEFNLSDEKSKHYAYYFSRAFWAGAKICQFQRSYEAQGLFLFVVKDILKGINMNNLYYQENRSKRYIIIKCRFNNNLLMYLHSSRIVQIIQVLGIQRLFLNYLQKNINYFYNQQRHISNNRKSLQKIWNLIEKYIYTYNKPYGLLDLVEKGGSNSQYSQNLSQELIEELDQFLHKQNVSELNSRVILKEDRLELLIASQE
ncbi:unnamed protein product [Paramecium pentaurelia]|uniref:Uncharacterized protein n=1 Tax=Paramecium pentaurelia TaxID=43138 RepID=A0A8S1SC14_9CILI|nr:unnamed protein product [Paramecium pentaurelia]